MKDGDGIERGACKACRARNGECCEFSCLFYPDFEVDWDEETSAEGHRRNPVLAGLAARLRLAASQPLDVGFEPSKSSLALCAGCGCPAEDHEALQVSATEALWLQIARATFAAVDLSSCIRQSVQDTTSLRWTRDDFVYGEVGSLSFLRMLDDFCNLRGDAADRGAFFDLGSGVGKAVVLAGLHRKAGFIRSVGVEILPGLAACARHVEARYRQLAAEGREAAGGAEAPAWTEVELVEGDLFETSLSDAALVLVNAGNWNGPSTPRLQQRLMQELPDGCFLATIRQPLFKEPVDCLVERSRVLLPMSWGVAPVYIAECLRNGRRRTCAIDLEAMD